jgi:hypothetical protein
VQGLNDQPSKVLTVAIAIHNYELSVAQPAGNVRAVIAR